MQDDEEEEENAKPFTGEGGTTDTGGAPRRTAEGGVVADHWLNKYFGKRPGRKEKKSKYRAVTESGALVTRHERRAVIRKLKRKMDRRAAKPRRLRIRM